MILYADKITDSMQYAMDETDRRREKQVAYNKEHGITPEGIKKKIGDVLESVREREAETETRRVVNSLSDKAQEVLEDARDNPAKLAKYIEKRRNEMREAAGNLEFEQAAKIRDEIRKLEQIDLGLN